VRPYLADAAVAIAPLRIARGTQNKVLECMAAGVPVVSSPQAARGIQANPGEHLLVAENASSFAAEVVRLMEDADLRSRLSILGRQQVQTTHVWAESMKLLDTLLEPRMASPAGLVPSMR